MAEDREIPAGEAAPTGTVARAVRLMAVLAEADHPLSIAELAERMSLPRPTAHRLVNLLRSEGIAEVEPASRRYQAGGEFLRIGALVANRHPLTELARTVMKRLVADSSETCLFGVYLPKTHQMMFAGQEASSDALGYRVELMQPVSVAWGASGRSILAFLPDDDVEEILSSRSERSPVSGKALPSAATLRREIAEIRRNGYAYTKAQKIAGSRGVAAPILGADGYARGSLCLTIPEFRFDEAKLPVLSELIKRHTAHLSEQLGYRRAVASLHASR